MEKSPKEDVQKRLEEASKNCLEAHKAWGGDKKNAEARETLMECVHELRKVAARLEIEIAISERDQMGNRPIPIPSHKSANSKKRNSDAAHTDAAGEGGNTEPAEDSGVPVQRATTRRRRSSRKEA